MKRKGILTLFVVLILLFPAAGYAAEGNQETFTVGMEVNYAPFNWSQTTADNGAVPVENSPNEYANGYDVWMAKQLADAMGKKLVIQKIEWDGLPPALISGKIDAIIAGMSPTPDRKEIIDFTDNYYSSDLVIVVQKNGSYASAASLEDFQGARITGQLNTFHYDVIDQIPGVRKETALDNFPTMITALLSGKIDGYVSERPGAMSAVQSSDALTYISFDEGRGFRTDPDNTSIAVGVQKSSPLKKQINDALSEITEEQRQSAMQEMVNLNVAKAPDSFFDGVMRILSGYGMLFLRGAGVTLLISLAGTIAGCVIGLLVQILRSVPIISGKSPIRNGLIHAVHLLCGIYVEVFRSTPMIVQAMLIYYGSKQFLNVDLNAIAAGMIVVSINTGAYLAETIRGGIDSVDRGQFEASYALGLSHWQMMIYVILPQALRAILPSIGNEFVVNIKDTSVLNVISVTELFFITKGVAGSTLLIFQSYLVAAVVYFVMTLCATQLIRLLSRKLNPDTQFSLASATGGVK
ncbi:MAG: ABC transporter permease subunit [Peptoniphilaceae bacterium]|nr:ABC transporter permease subunit [Peptoniphilaceae bacterium]